MHRLVLFALAIPLACLALLCWVAFLAVVMIAVGMYMVGTIKSLEGPRSRNTNSDDGFHNGAIGPCRRDPLQVRNFSLDLEETGRGPSSGPAFP